MSDTRINDKLEQGWHGASSSEEIGASAKPSALCKSTTVTLGKKWRNITPQYMRRLHGGAFFFVSEGSVVDFDGDAVVNAANCGCLGGGGVDGAIGKAGGDALQAARWALPVVKTLDNGTKVRCPTGEAKITEGGGLKATWCIHACGPMYHNGEAAKNDELLARAYKQSMLRAKENGIKTIAFSLLSAGVFLGPNQIENVLLVAVKSVCEGEYDGLEEVHLVGFKQKEISTLLEVARNHFESNRKTVETLGTMISGIFGRSSNTKETTPKMSSNIGHLLQKQHKYCPRIAKELRENGRKTSHWAWWVFPTDKPGFSEPLPETFVTHKERQSFLEHSNDTGWRECLELVAKLVSEKGSLGKVLPPIDHGRVKFFCLFWCDNFEPPSWLEHVIVVLKMPSKRLPLIVHQHESEAGSDEDSSDDEWSGSDDEKSRRQKVNKTIKNIFSSGSGRRS